MEGLKGKVAIITGASSGIGAATAEEFAKYGAHLVLTGRNTERLQHTSNTCQQKGLDEKNILLISCDLAQEDSLDQIVNQTIDTFGKIDILVNNAGLVQVASFQEITPDNLDAHYKVMVKAPLFLSQKALPHLKKTKGNIVNVSSILSSRSSVPVLGYGIAKAGSDHMTKALSVELGPFGIRVNAVNPGEIKTNMQASLGLQGEELEKYFQEVSSQYPLGRVAEPSEVAAAIVFLSSDAASFISGAMLPVDGAVAQTSSWTPSELKS